MSENKFLENKSLAIIILGNFNPSIFQPFWLAKKKLITEEEAQDAKVDIIHNELVVFSLGWAKIDVRLDRFEISTNSEPYFSVLKDLVVGIFFYLKETPAKAIGINYVFKLGLQDEKRYYDFGNKVAPLSNWDFMNDSRLTSIEVLERERSDGAPGHYRIRIESDQSVKFGVSVLMNDHFDLKHTSKENSSEILQVIETKWLESAKKADLHMGKINAKLL